MKTYALIFISLLLLAVAGCSTPEQIVEQKVGEKIADTKDAVKGAVVDKAVEVADKKSRDLVNMKCVENNKIFTYYLYKDKMRVDVKSPMEGADRQTWVWNATSYTTIKIGDKMYLVVSPAEESQVTYRSVSAAAESFETQDIAECEKGVVKESDFVLPDLEQITSQEMGEKMNDLFAAQGLPTQ